MNQAIEVVDDRGGRCARATMDELVAIKQLLLDESEHRALKRIRVLREHGIEKCPDRADRLLRSAAAQLDDRDDRRRDDRRHDDPPPPPKRASGVPYADFGKDCADYWLLNEIAHGRSAQLAAFQSMFSPTCQGAVGDAYYPNGTAARLSGAWYYPNGTMARSAGGDFYYPNGTMAKAGSGGWYYPNGTMAWSGASWMYPNGSQAGDYNTLASFACQKAGPAACNTWKLALNSDLDDYRAFAVIKLASATR
ncbi:MAG: hypothetical protein ABI678_03200 [Kofleriaceae bacterium]